MYLSPYTSNILLENQSKTNGFAPELFLNLTRENLCTAAPSRSPGVKEKNNGNDVLTSVENGYGRVVLHTGNDPADVGQHV